MAGMPLQLTKGPWLAGKIACNLFVSLMKSVGSKMQILSIGVQCPCQKKIYIYIHKKIDDKKPYMTIIAISAIRLAHACDGCMHSSINVCCKIWGSNHQCYLKNCPLIWTTRKNGNFNFAGRRCNSQSNITASVLLIESINQPVEK